MKIYVICTILFFAPAALSSFPSPTSRYDTFLTYEALCAKDSGVSQQSIEAAKQVRNLLQTPETNAFAKCMLLQYNVMNAYGVVNTDVSTYSISDIPDDLQRVSEICNRLRGNDASDTARLMLNCYWENNQLFPKFVPPIRF